MIGLFRKSDAHDPKIYALGVIELLSEYPEQIVFRVTSVTGPLVAKGDKYAPSISDIYKACEAEMKPFRDYQTRENRRAESDKVLNSGRNKAPIGSDEHKRVMSGFAALRGELDRTPQNPSSQPARPEARRLSPEELAEKWKDNPPAVSDVFRAQNAQRDMDNDHGHD